jgi:hypothetical protein
MRRFAVSNPAVRLSLGVAAAIGAALLPVRAQPPQPGGDLLAAARRGWEDYEKAARTWSFRVKYDWTIVDGDREKSSVDEILVRGNGRCFSIERTDWANWSRTPETKTRFCQVVGPDYQFEARRAPGGSGWALTSVISHADMRRAIANKEVPADQRTARDDIETQFLLIAVAVDNQLASRLIGHAGCRTERFAPVSPEPGALVEWRFTVDQAKRPREMRQVESGRVLFDPSNRWVISEYRTNNRNGRGGISTIHTRLTYQPGPGGYPAPTEMRSELVTDDQSYRTKGAAQFELVPQKAPLGDKEFTLSAYGLPEEARAPGPELFVPRDAPPGTQSTAEPTGTGWYFLLVAVGIALVVTALVIRFWQGRRRGNASPA